MGRSNGYRPKAACRKEVLRLRAQLAECNGFQWRKAGMIMDQITTLLGHAYGPMNAKIAPRACSYCNYYGHTRQWCKRRLEYQKLCEEYEIERMLKEDAALKARYEHVQTEREPYDATKTAQARCFDALRMPFTVRPDIGAVVGVVGEPHHGKWTFDASGGVVART